MKRLLAFTLLLVTTLSVGTVAEAASPVAFTPSFVAVGSAIQGHPGYCAKGDNLPAQFVPQFNSNATVLAGSKVGDTVTLNFLARPVGANFPLKTYGISLAQMGKWKSGTLIPNCELLSNDANVSASTITYTKGKDGKWTSPSFFVVFEPVSGNNFQYPIEVNTIFSQGSKILGRATLNIGKGIPDGNCAIALVSGYVYASLTTALDAFSQIVDRIPVPNAKVAGLWATAWVVGVDASFEASQSAPAKYLTVYASSVRGAGKDAVATELANSTLDSAAKSQIDRAAEKLMKLGANKTVSLDVSSKIAGKIVNQTIVLQSLNVLAKNALQELTIYQSLQAAQDRFTKVNAGIKSVCNW